MPSRLESDSYMSFLMLEKFYFIPETTISIGWQPQSWSEAHLIQKISSEIKMPFTESTNSIIWLELHTV